MPVLCDGSASHETPAKSASHQRVFLSTLGIHIRHRPSLWAVGRDGPMGLPALPEMMWESGRCPREILVFEGSFGSALARNMVAVTVQELVVLLDDALVLDKVDLRI